MSEYKCSPLGNNVEEMFIGPFGSSLKNECFVDEDEAYCMVYEQKHAIQKTMDVETRYVNEQKYNELKRFNVRGGDIIVSCRGTIGETFIVPDDAPFGIMHPSIMKIRLKEGVYDRYYFNLLLKSRLKKHEAEANGSGIKMAISATELGKELFPVPTMEEQLEITDIISRISSVIEKRKQELSALDDLIKARFVEMFGSIKEEQLLGDISEFVTVGIANSATHAYAESGIPMLRNQNIKENYLDDTDMIYIKPEFAAQYESKKLKENDIIVMRTGYPGVACLVPKKYEGCQTFTTLIVRLKEDNNPSYVCSYINSDLGKRFIDSEKVGVAQQNVGAKSLAKMPIKIARKQLQDEYADFVNQVDKSKVA